MIFDGADVVDQILRLGNSFSLEGREDNHFSVLVYLLEGR